MDLLVRYGEALGAERLVETNNVCRRLQCRRRRRCASSPKRALTRSIPSSISTVPKCVEVPRMVANTCQLITGIDNEQWRVQGIPDDLAEQQKKGEKYFGARGINMFATCTPYQVGNVPVKGEHCAWMESSAVIYCNAVLGARTNTEGKESTGAAALTGAHSVLGLSYPGKPPRHPSGRRRDRRRRHHGVGPARLLSRRNRRRRHSRCRPDLSRSRT